MAAFVKNMRFISKTSFKSCSQFIQRENVLNKQLVGVHMDILHSHHDLSKFKSAYAPCVRKYSTNLNIPKSNDTLKENGNINEDNNKTSESEGAQNNSKTTENKNDYKNKLWKIALCSVAGMWVFSLGRIFYYIGNKV